MSALAPIASSTVAKPGAWPAPQPKKNSFGVARRNKTQLALSTVDPRIAAIDRARAARGLSHQELCARAPLHPSNWYFLRNGQQTPKRLTIKRLEAALAASPPKPKIAPLAGLVHAAEALLRAAIGRDPALLGAVSYRRANRKAAAPALAAGRLRTLALYLVAVEVEVENVAIARALGITRANVHKARNTVEELADDPRVRSLLDRCAATLRGGRHASTQG